jgi:endonuclease YncB( thermonuclease family)
LARRRRLGIAPLDYPSNRGARVSINRPRRIFRSNSRPTAPRGLSHALIVGILGVGGIGALAMTGLSGALFGQMPPPPTLISAPADQVAVIDGDTLRLDGTIVRLSDLSAPPRGQACAAGPDCGSRASEHLADLVRDRQVMCHIVGYDELGRPTARCQAEGRDVNLDLVSDGWAKALGPNLISAETDAQAHHRGIWLAG